jgi:hypothetical protein
VIFAPNLRSPPSLCLVPSNRKRKFKFVIRGGQEKEEYRIGGGGLCIYRYIQI